MAQKSYAVQTCTVQKSYAVLAIIMDYCQAWISVYWMVPTLLDNVSFFSGLQLEFRLII
jgi:hypothetical protein